MKLDLLALLSLILLCYEAKATNPRQDTIHMASDTLLGLDLLDESVRNYRVFITGENHSYLESNSQLWVKQIKYLYQHAGVRNVMIEYGYASGWLIDQYINTGDSMLYEVLKAYSFGEYTRAYEALRKFNKALKPEDRIHVVGIDLERGVYSATKVLSLQLPKVGEAHDSIALDVESLKSLVKYTDKAVDGKNDDYDRFNSYSAINTLERIRKNFDAHPMLWRDYLGEAYPVFAKILKGFADMQTWKTYENDNSTHQFVYREKYMYNRFREEFLSRNGNFFGQFGRCHSAKSAQEQTSCNWYEFRSLASRIEESQELGLGKQVMTFGILYSDDTYEEDVWASIQSSIDSLFETIPSNRVMLYDLPGDSNLYSVLQDYFDYIYLNTTTPSKTYPYRFVSEEDTNSIEPEREPRNKFLAYAGALNLDLGKLNNYLNLATAFKDQLTMIGVEIVTTNERYDIIQSNLSIGSILKQQRNIDNALLDRSYKYELGGFFFNNFTAFNLTPGSTLLDLMPGFGFGFSQLRLRIVEHDNSRDLKPEEGFLGYEKVSEYVNPAFNFSLSGEIDLNLKNFTFGTTGGYQFDLSKKRWIANELLREGPETSLQGWFAQFHLGFNFANWE
ncbi:MAG: erythromycin esterase family protein [Flavobacteriales bacterium]|nr:erythromycin esterase family protein [Flavobacteriales bacterium]